MKTESYLFKMPADWEECLCAIAAIQGLLEEVVKREILPEVWVYCPDVETEFLAVALGEHVKCVRSATWDTAYLRDFDLVFEFDRGCAANIARTTNRHLSQAYSIMLGGAPKILPDLSKITVPGFVVPACDVYLLPWQGAETLRNMLSVNHSELSLVYDEEPVSSTLYEIWLCMVNSKMVMGPRSAATLLAAALGRSVIEIYSPKVHREWLSKWDNRNYQMLYMDELDVKPAMVYKAWEVQCLRCAPVK